MQSDQYNKNLKLIFKLRIQWWIKNITLIFSLQYWQYYQIMLQTRPVFHECRVSNLINMAI